MKEKWRKQWRKAEARSHVWRRKAKGAAKAPQEKDDDAGGVQEQMGALMTPREKGDDAGGMVEEGWQRRERLEADDAEGR